MFCVVQKVPKPFDIISIDTNGVNLFFFKMTSSVSFSKDCYWKHLPQTQLFLLRLLLLKSLVFKNCFCSWISSDISFLTTGSWHRVSWRRSLVSWSTWEASLVRRVTYQVASIQNLARSVCGNSENRYVEEGILLTKLWSELPKLIKYKLSSTKPHGKLTWKILNNLGLKKGKS